MLSFKFDNRLAIIDLLIVDLCVCASLMLVFNRPL